MAGIFCVAWGYDQVESRSHEKGRSLLSFRFSPVFFLIGHLGPSLFEAGAFVASRKSLGSSHFMFFLLGMMNPHGIK